jgi:P4 family phage/plasmid primase-like protien
LGSIAPTVESGGRDQGHHHYFKLRKKVKLKKKLKKYPGIDFLHHGNYVLIPGCAHIGQDNSYPEGGQYSWDPFSPDETPYAPDWLVAELEVTQGQRDAVSPDLATLSLKDIDHYLFSLDPTQYRDYEEWLQIGMSVHAASGGNFDAQELWVKWSISDPLFEHNEDGAREKWATFTADRESAITAGTLIKAAIDAGASLNASTPLEDFEGAPIEAAINAGPMDSWLEKLLTTKPQPRLLEAIKQAQRYGELHWEDIRTELKGIYGARLNQIDRIKSKLDAQAKQVKARQSKKPSKDPAIVIAEHILDTSFATGQHLVHAPNQQFYDYLGTHWEELRPNIVRQLILTGAETISKRKDSKLKFKPSSMFTSTAQVLEARTAQKQDIFRFKDPPPPVINAQNCEIWIAEDGKISARPHKPESYLLSCLDVHYDPHAECPLTDETLLGIFCDNDEPEEMVRHFWETVGYTIQPFKNIPFWAIWHGRGSNGKTILKELMCEILGQAMLPMPVASFADNTKNNHALASLVGKLLVVDDDARVDASLPESALKKLAESNLFEANPKGKDAFVFRASATALILINDWPRVRDLSHGMIRKAYILPFKHVFSKSEMDLDRSRTIRRTEMPGFLNRALEGYRRLRRRGHFAEPAECEAAKDEWLRAANPLIEFLASQVSKTTNGESVPLNDMYYSYQMWCKNLGGVRYPLAQNRFELSLRQLGYDVQLREAQAAIMGVSMEGDFD